jgi:competence ComEA-like helix-hairpin-helix protein
MGCGKSFPEKPMIELPKTPAPLPAMSIEDRDYMRTPTNTKSPKILGLPVWKFALYAVVLAGVCVWRFGVFGKMFPSGPVNINTATVEQLAALPDVDKKIAADIIAKRPFTSVDELLKVKGIGEKRLAKIRERVVVSEPAK